MAARSNPTGRAGSQTRTALNAEAEVNFDDFMDALGRQSGPDASTAAGLGPSRPAPASAALALCADSAVPVAGAPCGTAMHATKRARSPSHPDRAQVRRLAAVLMHRSS
eukprot:scaffold61576_cov48-Phaeocystis_antarctica.AAC.3